MPRAQLTTYNSIVYLTFTCTFWETTQTKSIEGAKKFPENIDYNIVAGQSLPMSA